VRDEEGKRSMLRSPWRRSIWIWAAVLEQAVSIQRIRLHLLLGRTVIADRYVTDTLADLHARLPEAVGHSSLVRPASLLLGAAPAAALSFIIELSPEAAFERKPDGGSLDGRRRLAQGYRTLSDAIRARRIDGLRSREEVAQEIVDVSLRLVFGRFTIAGGAGGERAT
jgi:thymidylate kinase